MIFVQDPSGGALYLGELPVILGQGGSLKMMEEDQVVPVTSGGEQDKIPGNGQGELRRHLRRASPRGLQSRASGVRQEAQMARQRSAQLPQVNGCLPFCQWPRPAALLLSKSNHSQHSDSVCHDFSSSTHNCCRLEKQSAADSSANLAQSADSP